MSVATNWPVESRPRRYRVLWMSPELLFAVLFNPRRAGDWIDVVRVEGLPDGCEVQAVCWSEERRAFGFRLWHATFEEVPGCDAIPEICPLVHQERVAVATATAPAADASLRSWPSGNSAMRLRPQPQHQRSAADEPLTVGHEGPHGRLTVAEAAAYAKDFCDARGEKVYVIEIPAEYAEPSPDDVMRLRRQLGEILGGKIAILKPGLRLVEAAQLRYSVTERLGDLEREIRFAKHEELLAHLAAEKRPEPEPHPNYRSVVGSSYE